MVKLDCFTVSMGVFKSVVDDQLDRLADSLAVSLKRQVGLPYGGTALY